MSSAAELKMLADKTNKDKEDPQIEEAYRRISVDLKGVAQSGRYTYTVCLSSMNISKKIWQEVGKRLQKDGFEVSFETQTTAWYTNTDWDQEDIIRVSWL